MTGTARTSEDQASDTAAKAPSDTDIRTAGNAAEDRSPRSRGGRRVRADLEHGLAVIRAEVKRLPNKAGVYRMLDEHGEVLYVGKARELKKRVNSYSQAGRQPARLLRMIAETVAMEIVVTRSEVEALLLEANLIKRLRPRYNVLLRDDKTFPHILIAEDHPYPRITKHRGAQTRKGAYFGPFASAGAVNRTINALQRAFLLRNCSDAVFSQRTRPCLQYQIKRCTAPCVDYVGEADYRAQVDQARAFLAGRASPIQNEFAARMQAASDALDFESAARWRDRVRALAAIQSSQDINLEGLGDADAIACHQEGGQTCVQVYFFRGGRNYGTRAYFPGHDRSLEPPEVLAGFIGQFYDQRTPPAQLLLSHALEEQDLLAEALTVLARRKVTVGVPRRGEKRRLIEHALANAKEALARRLAETASQGRLLGKLADVFGLDSPPRRIEVYDNSHTGGTNALGGMVVAGPDGFLKSAYRKFNIKDKTIAPGDDYAMMREVLTRRFSRALKEDPERDGETWPDLVLIDGGQGQLGVAVEVLAELGLDDIAIAGVAKGPDRNAGRERFFMPDRPPFSLEPRDPVLYYIQRLRDEAHRFAIGGHRARRQKAIGRNPVDDIPGIGPKRKKALLMHFGSGRAVARATVEDLAKVEGISEAVAKRIHDHFQNSG